MKKNVGKKFIPFAIPLLLVLASTMPEAATNEGTFDGFSANPSEVAVVPSALGGGNNSNGADTSVITQSNLVNQSKINLLAENSTDDWLDVNNTDFLQVKKIPDSSLAVGQYWKLVSVKGDSSNESAPGQIILYYMSDSPTITSDFQLQLIKDNSLDDLNYYLYFRDFKAPSPAAPIYKASIDLKSYTLSLAGSSENLAKAAIQIYRITDSYAPRALTIYGDEDGEAQLILKNPNFGIMLGGRVDFNINNVKRILVSGEDKEGNLLSNPLREGIVLVSRNNWSVANPSVDVIIDKNDQFEISGNIAEALGSYGNNSFNLVSRKIKIDTNVVGIPLGGTAILKEYRFNTLISGSGKIALTASDGINLAGKSTAEDNKIYRESFAIRSDSETICNDCGDAASRRYNSEFSLSSNKSIELDTNWGAIFMEGVEFLLPGKDEEEDKIVQYYAHTSLEAPEITIIASGSSQDQRTNASFRVESNLTGDNLEEGSAKINLHATGPKGIAVHYKDALGEEQGLRMRGTIPVFQIGLND